MITKKIIAGLLIIAAASFALQLPVTTRQGINYKVTETKIPLYLKLLDFFTRHVNYAHLSKEITRNAGSDEDRILKILKWVHDNIRPQPKELPVIDDHVWNIIIRGYGTDDQHADVFSTLCEYAGFESYFSIYKDASGGLRAISLVKLHGAWKTFSPYTGSFLARNHGTLAGYDECQNNSCEWQLIDGSRLQFLKEAYTSQDGQDFKRSQIQSPFKRLIYGIKKAFGVSE